MGQVSEFFSPLSVVTGRPMDKSNSSNEPGVHGQRTLVDVLLVEDNFIIALDTEDMLRQLGVQTVRTAGSVIQALDFIDAEPPQFALLDVNLGDEKCFEIAVRLRDLGVPFAFATGYGDKHGLPAEFANALIVPKPYNLDDLERAIGSI